MQSLVVYGSACLRVNDRGMPRTDFTARMRIFCNSAPRTLDLYHLYFAIELWCWMAQIGNKEALGNLALDSERFLLV
jgi:hypothetical protein